MNYTIKAIEQDVIIGGQLFTQQPINLVEITCLDDVDFETLVKAVTVTKIYEETEVTEIIDEVEVTSTLTNLVQEIQPTLTILKQGIEVENKVEVISMFFTLLEESKTAKELLKEDLATLKV